ncbi:glyoxalase domain-containing protein 4-like [Physella acuta]|uniref:glyoxalase domain-containing protein 4-like n=1 Tax=Physella acuta TaxID=109671 RepID=UPI0027DD6852|nr:glyoxalase domain-containing protein 4-like [Physella acuta]
MTSSSRRALHFVFKVGNRTENARFYRDVLGMQILRHEEFEEGCKAACNGPYDGKWSKTMVGYGPEDNHFVAELTYNYGIGSYKLGNDFLGITVSSKSVFERAKGTSDKITEENGACVISSPDGYVFKVLEKSVQGDPVQIVTLASSNLLKSIDFWVRLCGMKIFDQQAKSAILGYADDQCKLELVDIEKPVDHGTAFGRIAFSCPSVELPALENLMKSEHQTILTPLVSLDTPGKATVQVVIIADPDGHEICYVGDEAFRELSKADKNANTLLDEAITADKSDDWFAKKGKTKVAA